MKIIVLLILMLNYMQVFAADTDDKEWKWYKNEISCTDYKIKVRTRCKSSEVENGWHGFCAYQEMLITTSQNKIITKYLLEKDDLVPDGPRHLGMLECAIAPDKTPYLLMLFDNGGNCNTCEISGVMDMQGVWKNYGEKWFNTTADERKKIDKLSWREFKEFYIKNAVLDEKQE